MNNEETSAVVKTTAVTVGNIVFMLRTLCGGDIAVTNVLKFCITECSKTFRQLAKVDCHLSVEVE